TAKPLAQTIAATTFFWHFSYPNSLRLLFGTSPKPQIHKQKAKPKNKITGADFKKMKKKKKK
ncbi:hypothetical protein OAF61_04460, partial [Pseudomonadales bacterium]|nr:hypothetical protein [Pseudomonadales bacterium]